MTDIAPRHLLHVFPSFGIGGVPLRIVRIINHLGARCRHTIVALDGSLAAGARLDPAVTADLVALQLDKGKPLANVWRYRRMLATLKPDLLLTYNWGSVEWAAANRILPLVRHIHFESGFGVEEAGAQLPRRVMARRWALARCECIVVPSHTLEAIALNTWRLPARKVRYIANGIDVGPARANLEIAKRADSEIVVGTVAPLRPEKNVGRLIRAVASLGDAPFRLAIVGDGMERAKLEALANELGIASRVVFHGESSKPAELLAQFDIFALSSDTEQMPNALLEAMVEALPVAAVDVGDVRVLVAEENRRFIVPRDDVAALGEAIRALGADARLRHTLGARNRERVLSEYPQERMFAEYESLLLS